MRLVPVLAILGAEDRTIGGITMTFVWFVVWFVADHVGSHAPLRLDPVNVWAGTFLLAVALDLAGSHARGAGRAKR